MVNWSFFIQGHINTTKAYYFDYQSLDILFIFFISVKVDTVLIHWMQKVM